MDKLHLHMPGWIHNPDWYHWGVRFDQLIHDRRFWGGLALAALFGLMIALIFLLPKGSYEHDFNPIYPTYPYFP